MLNNEELAIYVNNQVDKIREFYPDFSLYINFINVKDSKQDGNYAFYEKTQYHYVYQERGIVENRDHRKTFDEFEISYWILKEAITFYGIGIASSNGNLSNFKRVSYEKQLEMLSILGREYKDRFIEEEKK